MKKASIPKRGIAIDGYKKVSPKGYFKNYYSSGALGLIVFLIIAIAIAPMTHESFHIIILKQLNCPYTFSIHRSYEVGITAEVTPLGSLTNIEAVVFLAAGIMGNMFIAIFLSLLILYARREKHMIWGNLLTFAMIGFASDPLFYFFATEGDIVVILKILGRQENLYIFSYMGYMLAISVFLYLWSHLSFTIEHKSKLEEEWEKMRSIKRRVRKRSKRKK